ncbi:hypothetical protein SLA2020_111790 [Shorea laevis]
MFRKSIVDSLQKGSQCDPLPLILRFKKTQYLKNYKATEGSTASGIGNEVGEELVVELETRPLRILEGGFHYIATFDMESK